MSAHALRSILLTASLLMADASWAGVDEVRASIEATNRQMMDAISKGDTAAIVDLYSSNAEILPPYHEIVSGREAIRKFWDSTISSGLKRLKLMTLEVESRKDMAFEVGEYVVPGDHGETLARGKYLVVWLREDGHWKLHRDTIAPTTLLR